MRVQQLLSEIIEGSIFNLLRHTKRMEKTLKLRFISLAQIFTVTATINVEAEQAQDRSNNCFDE